MHQNITEEHIVEFIVHYVLNNYGVDISHLKICILKYLFIEKQKERILDEN